MKELISLPPPEVCAWSGEHKLGDRREPSPMSSNLPIGSSEQQNDLTDVQSHDPETRTPEAGRAIKNSKSASQEGRSKEINENAANLQNTVGGTHRESARSSKRKLSGKKLTKVRAQTPKRNDWKPWDPSMFQSLAPEVPQESPDSVERVNATTPNPSNTLGTELLDVEVTSQLSVDSQESSLLYSPGYALGSSTYENPASWVPPLLSRAHGQTNGEKGRLPFPQGETESGFPLMPFPMFGHFPYYPWNLGFVPMPFPMMAPLSSDSLLHSPFVPRKSYPIVPNHAFMPPTGLFPFPYQVADMDYEAMAAKNEKTIKKLRREAVVGQLAYYFSMENLIKDTHLRMMFDRKNGGVPLREIAQFERMKNLIGDDWKQLVAAAKECKGVEILGGDEPAVRVKDWQIWALKKSEKRK